MYNSKMLEMLKHFTSKELGRMSDYLASPYFNRDEQVLLFYHHIKKYAPEFSHKNLDKKQLLKKGITGVDITEKKLGYLMSDMVRHIEGFIKHKNFIQNKLDANNYLLTTYNNWESDKFFEQTLRESKEHLQKYPLRDADFFYKEFILQSQQNLYFDRQKKRAYDASLQKAADYLDLYYLAIKLKYSCELINRQKLVAADYELRLLKEITQHLQENSYDAYPPIAIYHKILMMFLENENELHFQKLKELLNEHAFKFQPVEARDLYSYAQNYCIRKINSGATNYLNELLHIYKTNLERKFLLVDGEISPWAFKNMVSVALRVGDFEWVEQFIKNYKQYINEKFRDNAFNYNQACLLFFKNKFGEALKLLNQVEFTDIFYSLDSRSMQIKIYYELEETEPLQSSIDAFKTYLRRNKTISDNVRTIYMNLVKFTDKLSRINNYDAQKAKILKDKIEHTKQVADIKWLLSKAEEKRIKK